MYIHYSSVNICTIFYSINWPKISSRGLLVHTIFSSHCPFKILSEFACDRICNLSSLSDFAFANFVKWRRRRRIPCWTGKIFKYFPFCPQIVSPQICIAPENLHMLCCIKNLHAYLKKICNLHSSRKFAYACFENWYT